MGMSADELLPVAERCAELLSKAEALLLQFDNQVAEIRDRVWYDAYDDEYWVDPVRQLFEVVDTIRKDVNAFIGAGHMLMLEYNEQSDDDITTPG